MGKSRYLDCYEFIAALLHDLQLFQLGTPIAN